MKKALRVELPEPKYKHEHKIVRDPHFPELVNQDRIDRLSALAEKIEAEFARKAALRAEEKLKGK